MLGSILSHSSGRAWPSPWWLFFGARRLRVQSLPHWRVLADEFALFSLWCSSSFGTPGRRSYPSSTREPSPWQGAEAQACSSESYVSGAACYSPEERWNPSCYLRSLSRDDCFTIGPDCDCDTASKSGAYRGSAVSSQGCFSASSCLFSEERAAVAAVSLPRNMWNGWIDLFFIIVRSCKRVWMENRDKKLAEVTQLENDYMQLQLLLHTCLPLVPNVSLRERTPWIWKGLLPFPAPPVSSEESAAPTGTQDSPDSKRPRRSMPSDGGLQSSQPLLCGMISTCTDEQVLLFGSSFGPAKVGWILSVKVASVMLP